MSAERNLIETPDYIIIVHGFPTERASQEQQIGANFSSVAPWSGEL